MEKIQWFNCGIILEVEEIKKGVVVTCECVCKQRCIKRNEYISKWRIINEDELNKIE